MIRKNGFTLVEIIIAVVLAGIISAVFALVISSGMDSWIFLRGQRSLMAQTRAAIKRVAKEVRATKNNQAANIIIFTATEYEFVDINNQTIEFKQVGTDLKRNNVILLTNLLNPGGLIFSYFDSYGNLAAARENIRTVQINLIVRDGGNQLRLRSAAALRNR